MLAAMSTHPSLRALLDVAVEVAWAAGRRTLGHFRNGRDGVAVDIKADGTPVTVADREAEQVMRAIIGRAFPTHTVLGEEQGEQAGDPDYRWILDPIDGTKTFVAGVPLYGTLVGVEVRGEPAVGVVNMPALGELVAAATGLGCTVNGRPCGVSSVRDLGQALVGCTDVRDAQRRGPGWDRLASETRLQRTWGDCYSYVLVATGRAEVALDPEMNTWDCAALMPIIEEAGGRFTAWSGERTIRGGDAVATNGALHDVVLGLLDDRRDP
jgi:histidinol phosphatase-like enzyme (inositol monophosphatase family)